MKEPGFRVAIIGGGVGGLALANSLQHAGIDYVLIEKAKSLDPQVGASIGILPNGARILDQLGCFDDLAAMTVPMVSTATHAADGSLIGGISDTLSLMKQRTGYPVIFIDRQLLLRSLARQILDPGRILLGKTVRAVEQSFDKATVECEDGTVIEADIVVGSDGVHSFVRQEMWRHADATGEGDLFTQDKQAMSAEYKCLFGISTSIPGMEPGQTDRTYASGMSTLSYVGKHGRVSWFVFIKMDRTYHPPHIPRFAQEDINAVIQEHGSLALRSGSKVTVADLYQRQVACNLVAIEEAQYQHWSYGRLTCMGDSIHKMTPNLGAGASSAMESAAVLSNVLVRLASRSAKPPLHTVRAALEEYQAMRTLRVGRAMNSTNKLTRLQALQTTKDYIFAHYISPRMDDYYAEAFSSFVIGAPIVEHLPIPERSLQGTMPFNPKQGWGYEEPMMQRVRRALPLLVMVLLSLQYPPQLDHWLHRYLPVGGLRDDAAHGSNKDSAIIPRELGLSIDSAVIYGVWLLESTRLSNKATLIQFPLLFGLFWQYINLRWIPPLYLFLLYIQTPIEKFRASDVRLTDVSYTSSVGPLLFLLGVLPTWLEHCALLGHDDMHGISKILACWTFRSSSVPMVLLSGLQFLLARFVRPSTLRADRIEAVDRDLKFIRSTTGVFALTTCVSWISYLSWWWVGLRQDGSMSFLSKLQVMMLHMHSILGLDGMLISITLAIWLGLVARDLRNAGMMQTNWETITALGVISLICTGPGTMFVAGWQWREEILVRRRHRDAVTQERQTVRKVR